jgi:hypothetical protein
LAKLNNNATFLYVIDENQNIFLINEASFYSCGGAIDSVQKSFSN